MAGKLLITPNAGSTTEGQDPTIKFQGTGNSTDMTLRVTSAGSLSVEGTSGQLFSVTDSMSGTIFSANDVSGIPSIEVIDSGLVKLAQYSGNVVIGSATDDGKKFQVTGTSSYTGESLHKVNARTVYGPNSSWSGYLYIGGDGVNGITRTPTIASIVGTNGGLHLDAGSDKGVYLNYYTGTAGTYFGNGAGATVASVSAAGVFAGNGSGLTNLTGANISTVAAAVSADSAGAVANYSPDNGTIIQSYNASAGNAAQFTIKHNGGAVDMYNARGALNITGTLTGSSTACTGEAATAVRLNTFGQTADACLPGYGIRTFYQWGGTNIGAAAPTATSSYTVGFTVGDHPYDGAYGWQLAQNMWNNELWFRTRDASTWRTWYSILHSGNYNGYSPTLTGAGASGNWGINVTGSSASCTGAAASVTSLSGHNISELSNNSGYITSSGTSAACSGNAATAGVAGSLSGAGGNYITRTTSGTAYSSGIQVREYNLGGAQGSAMAYAPMIAFHWAGIVASSIMMEASGRIGIFNNPGTGYEAFVCGNEQNNSLGVGTGPSGTAGEIRATNNITAYYSDDRLKTRTGNIENALDKISTLDTFYYHANETAQALGYKPVPEVGISAQQVQAIMPQVVAPAPIDDQYLTVRYEKLVPLLIAAIKEQQAIIESQEQRLAQLETMINKP